MAWYVAGVAAERSGVEHPRYHLNGLKAAALESLYHCHTKTDRIDAHVAIDWNHIIVKDLRLKGIYGREMFETWCKMAGVIASGLHLTPIIHHLPKERFRAGFDRMKSGESGKIILDRA